MPQGLYIIRKGFVKIGIEKLIKHELPGKKEAWFTSNPENFKHITNLTDPLPESKQNLQSYKMKEQFTLNIESGEQKSPAYVKSVKNFEDLVKDKLYKK